MRHALAWWIVAAVRVHGEADASVDRERSYPPVAVTAPAVPPGEPGEPGEPDGGGDNEDADADQEPSQRDVDCTDVGVAAINFAPARHITTPPYTDAFKDD